MAGRREYYFRTQIQNLPPKQGPRLFAEPQEKAFLVELRLPDHAVFLEEEVFFPVCTTGSCATNGAVAGTFLLRSAVDKETAQAILDNHCQRTQHVGSLLTRPPRNVWE